MRWYHVCFGAGIAAFCGLFVGSATADLIGTVDYSDTFTVDGVTRTDGLYSETSSGAAYDVEHARSGLATAHWTPMGVQSFSFNTSATALSSYGYNTTNNSGAATGVAQGGGGENGFAYNLRSDFIFQTDYAYRDGDYFDIWCGDGTGRNTLFVMVRKGNDSLGIGYLNAAGAYTETLLGITSGIASDDSTWHNAAARFNKDNDTVGIYVDESLKATVDLTTLAGGAYKDYSTNYVGWGGDWCDDGVNLYVSWVDNVAVGSAVPEPGSILLTAMGLVGLLAYAWRKRK